MDACDVATSLGAAEVEGKDEMNRKQFLKSLVLSALMSFVAGTHRVREFQLTNYSTVTTAPGCSGAKMTNTFTSYVERTNYTIETDLP